MSAVSCAERLTRGIYAVRSKRAAVQNYLDDGPVIVADCFHILTVRREFTQHIFVFGISGICSFMQHNHRTAIVDVTLGADDVTKIFLTHSTIYLLLFVVCPRIEQWCFVKMMPPKKFFDDYGKFVAVLPLVMIFGVLILWAQEPLIHAWKERFSRFYLPFAFFFFYRHIMVTTNQLQEQHRTSQNLRCTKDQLAVLGEYNSFMQKSRDAIVVMRHDLRHSYRLLYMMLLDGRVDAAKDYLEAQEKSLDKTFFKNFCKPPLLNAALKVSPSKSVTKSTCRKLLPPRRQIAIAIQQVGEQFVLEVANLQHIR